MTTPPVVSVTDELIAELEEIATRDTATKVTVKACDLRAMLAHIAELKRDAERYRWLREACDNDPGNLGLEYAENFGVDAAIDTAMRG